MQTETSELWAQQEYGHCDLGHQGRTNRLVKIAAAVAQAPHGRVSVALGSDPAGREGAYRFVQSDRVSAEQMVESSRVAALTRAEGQPFVFVPIDGTSLTLVDHHRSKNFGPIGTHRAGARGLKAITALVVSPDGVSLGLGGLHWWTRAEQDQGPQAASRDKREVHDKETQKWCEVIEQLRGSAEQRAQGPKLWYQLDREADAWPILHQLYRSGQWFTVRSNHNRRLYPQRQYLHQQLQKQRVLGHLSVSLPQPGTRKKTQATLSVRVLRSVTLRLRDRRSGQAQPRQVNAVLVQQIRTPRGQTPVRWRLLTNHPVQTLQQVSTIVQGYGCRWRIEEFHRTWKQGKCQIEQTQLHTTEHVQRWATVIAAMAVRIERLKYLARNQPDQPAIVELSENEIAALRLLFTPRGRPGTASHRMPANLTIGIAVDRIARLGGYTGKSSGGPPGSTTIGRGLEKLSFAAHTLDLVSEHERKK